MVTLLTLCSALGTGLMAGVFFAFSTFVMNALERLPPAQGMAAMQSINVAAINPWFMGLFLGTGVCCLLSAISGLRHLDQSGAGLRVIGCLLYVVGGIGVTMLFNVPRNNLLAAARSESPEAQILWVRYLSEWTAWNHVRGLAALFAAVLLTVALAKRGLQ